MQVALFNRPLDGVFSYVAEVTDNYDSDDVDGEFSGGNDINEGEVEYSICQTYGDSLMPWAFHATATLFALFVDQVEPDIGIYAPSSPDSFVILTASPDGAGNMGTEWVEFQYSTNGSTWADLSTDTSSAGGWTATQDLDWLAYGSTVYYRARGLDQGRLYSDWAQTSDGRQLRLRPDDD